MQIQFQIMIPTYRYLLLRIVFLILCQVRLLILKIHVVLLNLNLDIIHEARLIDIEVINYGASTPHSAV